MREDELFTSLKEHGQEHIIEAYEKLDDAGKKKLAEQLEKIDWDMVAMAGNKEAAQERGKLEPLSALEVSEIEANKAAYEAKGLEAIRQGKVGAVLLAGGQGTRLGSDGPKGKYNIAICLGTACFVKGSEKLLDTAKEALKIKEGETTEDGKFSLTACRCIGACGLAPVLTVNEDVFGRLTVDDVDGILAKYAD